MKNIWIMLLLVCSACAFTACNDDDKTEPQTPKRLAKMIFSDSYGMTLEYVLTYKDKQIETIKLVTKGEGEEPSETTYEVKQAENKVTMDNGSDAFVYTLKDGKVSGSNVYETDYRWEYDAEGFLASVIAIYPGEEEGQEPTEEEVLKYVYSKDKNLDEISGSGLEFGTAKNVVNGVDPVVCIYRFFLTAIYDEDFFPHLLGLCGNSSVNLPISSDVNYGNAPITYTWEEWGGVKSITYTSEEEVSTLVFEYED